MMQIGNAPHRFNKLGPCQRIGKLYEIPEANLGLLLVCVAALAEVCCIRREVWVEALQPTVWSAAKSP